MLTYCFFTSGALLLFATRGDMRTPVLEKIGVILHLPPPWSPQVRLDPPDSTYL